MKPVVRARRRSRRLGLSTLLPHTSHPPPAASSALHALSRSVGPPRPKVALGWLRASGHASTLATLAQAFLKASDAHTIKRFLRAGHHDQAAKRFCERFSERQFPLGYAYTGRDLIVELTGGIHHEGYADNWEEIGDLWSLKPVFLLSWSLMEDPYGPLRDEFVQDDLPDDDKASPDRLCDEARAAIAHLAGLPAQELFAGVPPDGFPAEHLRPRFTATCWEPLLWAAPWLWRLSGNPFLDRDDDDYPEPEPWSASSIFRLTAQYREAERIMRAIDGFNSWLEQAPGQRSSAAIQAACCPPSDRISTLLDLPIADCHDECSCPHLAPVCPERNHSHADTQLSPRAVRRLPRHAGAGGRHI